MNIWMGKAWRIARLTILGLSLAAAAQNREPVESFKVEKGTAAFDVGTNVGAVSVHGTSNQLQASVRMRQTGDQLLLEQVEAWLPVKTIGTGMGLRDEHMRKYVFLTEDGQMPDVKFTASDLTCPATRGGEVECPVAGSLAIRGAARPFRMVLKVREDGGAFHANGEGTIKLSDYGIERPSQLGVKTDDEVKLRVEFSGRAASVEANSRGSR